MKNLRIYSGICEAHRRAALEADWGADYAVLSPRLNQQLNLERAACPLLQPLGDDTSLATPYGWVQVYVKWDAPDDRVYLVNKSRAEEILGYSIDK